MSAWSVWPIRADELARVCGGVCPRGPLREIVIERASVGDVAPAPGQLFVPIQEDIDGHVLVERALAAGVSLALVSKAWEGRAALTGELAARCVVVDDALTAYRALAAHLRRGFSFPVLAVAGANGKTTTKEVVAALLEAVGRSVSKTPQTMNGFTGIPYTLCLPRHHRGDPPDVLVLEIGIDAIGAMADHARVAAPDVAVITALGAEHLEGLESEARAAEEELVLFAAASRRVFVADDPHVRAALSTSRAGDVVVAGEETPLPELSAGVSVLRYRGRRASPSANEVAFAWHVPGEAVRRGQRRVPLGGAHNVRNFAAAMGAVLALERVTPDALFGSAGLSVAVPAMRCQIVETPAGPTLVDDCYNASPASVRAALALVAAPAWRHRPRHVVLGEMLDLGGASEALHAALARDLPDARYVFVGDALREIAAAKGAGWLPRGASAEAIVQALAPARDAVVLVKGSRGVGLERVVRALAATPAAATAPAPVVAVVGEARRSAARLVAAAMGRAGTGDVIALDARALPSSPRGMRAALYTGFALEPGLAPPEGVAPEELALALMAQPFLHLSEGGAAVVAADDPTTAVLRLAVPDHARTVMFGSGPDADVRWELAGDELTVHVPPGDLVSLVWPDGDSVVAAVAAIAVAHALGESVSLAAAAVEGAGLG